MLYIQSVCPICGTGVIGFRMCSDGSTIVMMCEECDSLWMDPRSVSVDRVLYSDAPDFLVPGLPCSIKSPASRWATRDEVARAGWESLVFGEGTALSEA